jgi:hypothetical protein
LYVGLYPDNAISMSQWTIQGSGSLTLTILQTDSNFHLGAYYYITCQAVSGRTIFSLQVTQNRKTTPLFDGEINKDEFIDAQERVKNYYF